MKGVVGDLDAIHDGVAAQGVALGREGLYPRNTFTIGGKDNGYAVARELLQVGAVCKTVRLCLHGCEQA